jgi:hypothetical protein
VPRSLRSAAVGSSPISSRDRDLAAAIDHAPFLLRSNLSDGTRNATGTAPRLLPRSMVQRVTIDDCVTGEIREVPMVPIDESLEDW